MKTLGIADDPYIENRIPAVLLDYLCALVEVEATTQEIILTSCVLGMGTVQDITCKTIWGTVSRRVFGFLPVDVRLQVSVHENQIELAIAG